MALVVKKPSASISERWETYQAGISFKLAGLDNEQYQLGLERARRLIARQDAAQTLQALTVSNQDRQEHDIQCALMGQYIIRDWQGDIQDEIGNTAPYSAESAADLLKGDADLFVWVLSRSAEIATEARRQVAETVGKP